MEGGGLHDFVRLGLLREIAGGNRLRSSKRPSGMVSFLKTLAVALVASAVTAGAVLFYIDRKIDQTVEAVVAPIEETVGVVNDSVESVTSGVDSAVESLSRTADDVIEQADRSISEVDELWETTTNQVLEAWASTETAAQSHWESAQEAASGLRGQVQHLYDSFLPQQ